MEDVSRVFALISTAMTTLRHPYQSGHQIVNDTFQSFQLEGEYSMPEEVREKQKCSATLFCAYISASGKKFLYGIIPMTDLVWVSVDETLFLWVATKNSLSCPPLVRQDIITAVGVAYPALDAEYDRRHDGPDPFLVVALRERIEFYNLMSSGPGFSLQQSLLS
jgi:hypothetical protein